MTQVRKTIFRNFSTVDNSRMNKFVDDIYRAINSVSQNEVGDLVAGPVPASSTDNAIAIWDGTSGRLLQDTSWTIDGTTLYSPSQWSGTIDCPTVRTNTLTSNRGFGSDDQYFNYNDTRMLWGNPLHTQIFQGDSTILSTEGKLKLDNDGGCDIRPLSIAGGGCGMAWRVIDDFDTPTITYAELRTEAGAGDDNWTGLKLDRVDGSTPSFFYDTTSGQLDIGGDLLPKNAVNETASLGNSLYSWLSTQTKNLSIWSAAAGSYVDVSGSSWTDLTDGGDTTLHIHDGRYYTETELTNHTVNPDFLTMKINGTSILDSSRNLTNIGTVGCGAITTIGALTITKDSTIGGTFRVEASTHSAWFTVGESAGVVQFNSNGGTTRAGGIDLGARFNIAPINDAVPTLAIRGYTGGTSDIIRVSSPAVITGDYFILKSNGSVGINTVAPGKKLDVTGDIRCSEQFINTKATGTAPLAVTSTTLNTNLNADLWDGYQFADYLDQAVKTTSDVTLHSLMIGAGTFDRPLVVYATGASPVAKFQDDNGHAILFGMGAGAPDDGVYIVYDAIGEHFLQQIDPSTKNTTFYANLEATSYSVGGVAGVDASIEDADGNTLTFTKGILTAVTPP